MNSTSSFASLGLADSLLQAIHAAGYDHPTPIQQQAIPQIIAGSDVLAAAQTGTGKTAGFTLPILHRLLAQPLAKRSPGRPRVVILAPTRELAAQVHESVLLYSQGTRLRSLVMYGGVNINPQIRALQQPVDILVATPGRLLDHCQQKTLLLDQVEILVLDEADRMLDMGFIHDIRRVLRLLPKQRQNLLFSATFSNEIRELAHQLLNQPVEISVAPRNTTADRIDQQVIHVDAHQKTALISHMIRESGWHQVLVFCRTKHGANRLAERLTKDGLQAAALHGNKSQSARTRALDGFKTGKIVVLVATDIAARGIDIDQLPYVINFELPQVAEDYVHRIGRTGRAGSEGLAISLVAPAEQRMLHSIEKLIKRTIDERALPDDFEPPARPVGAVDAPEHEAPRKANTRRQHRPKGAPTGRRSGAGRGGNASSDRSSSSASANERRTSTSDRNAPARRSRSRRSGSAARSTPDNVPYFD